MWSKSNADKLKMELSGKRDKQLSVKHEKIADDNVNVKMDSGFLSDANLSCDNMLSKENIEFNDTNSDPSSNLKETSKTALDSGLGIDESGCLSELDVDQKDNCKPWSNSEHNWKFYFQQNENGDT